MKCEVKKKALNRETARMSIRTSSAGTNGRNFASPLAISSFSSLPHPLVSGASVVGVIAHQ